MKVPQEKEFGGDFPGNVRRMDNDIGETSWLLPKSQYAYVKACIRHMAEEMKSEG